MDELEAGLIVDIVCPHCGTEFTELRGLNDYGWDCPDCDYSDTTFHPIPLHVSLDSRVKDDYELNLIRMMLGGRGLGVSDGT